MNITCVEYRLKNFLTVLLELFSEYGSLNYTTLGDAALIEVRVKVAVKLHNVLSVQLHMAIQTLGVNDTDSHTLEVLKE